MHMKNAGFVAFACRVCSLCRVCSSADNDKQLPEGQLLCNLVLPNKILQNAVCRALDRKQSVTFVQFNRLSVCVGCKPTANALCRQTQGSQFCTTHDCSRQLDATVLKDHLGALPHTTCPESVVSASGTAAAAAESALADLIHAVPQLLEVMLPDTLAALLATNTVHRKQVHDFVTCITVTDLYVNALIAGSWPRLTKWKLNPVQSASEAVDRLIMEPFGLDAATTALFIKGELQELQGLNVFGRPCKQIIPEIVKANWPHLQSLSLSDAGMDVSDMQNLLAGTWPQLKILDLSGNALTHESILQLVRGDWPQLETLSLKGNQIGFLAAKELVKGAWPLLKRLYLSQNNLDQSAMQMLLTGKWPLLDCLSIRSNPVCCSIIADEQAVIGEGTTSNHTSSIHMSALFNLFRGDCEAATTAWPELKMLYW